MNTRKDDRGRSLHRGEYQRKDLRYCYSYMDPFHKRRWIYATSLVELRKKEEKFIRNQLDGLTTYSCGDATVNFVFDRYISLKTHLKASTLSNYRYMYERFVRNTLGRMKITDVKYSDVMYFYSSLIRGKGFAVDTLDTIHTLLHPTFQLAVMDNIIRKNPADGVMRILKMGHSRPKTTRNALTVEQQRAIMGYVESNPFFYRWGPILTILLGTGCRIGEMLGLRWSDVDFENKMISINHNLTYFQRHEDDDNGITMMISLPKTEAGIRTIPMSEKVEEAFRRIKRENRASGLKSETIDGFTDFIFLTGKGKVMRSVQVNRAFSRIVKAYNKEEAENAGLENREPVTVPHFSAHSLRHTFCTRLCENEPNIKVIQSLMGHADITTTLDIYTHVTEAKKKEAFGNLEAMNIF